MTATVSMHLRDLMVKLAFRNDVTPAPPANLWVGLTYDVAPSNSPGYLTNEPILGGYLRQSYPLASTHWAASGFGEVANIAAITFPEATLDWGLLQGWALYDTSSVGTGKTWASGSLVTPTYVEENRTIVVSPRGIVIGLYD